MKTYETQRASEMFCLLVDDLSKPPLDVMRAISKVQHTGKAILSDTILSAWKDGAGDDHFRAVHAD
jgi:hypothetical protein